VNRTMLSQLGVSNADFLVASTIERCPKQMMIRELLQNALEASASSSSPAVIVEATAVPGEAGRKLRIWNTGVGMDASSLHRMCDIASSVNKVNALDRNFGMGAKVASLPSNQRGLRYRSCREGVVRQVTMVKRGGVYGRDVPAGSTQQSAVLVVDEEEEIPPTGGSLSSCSVAGQDWTDVTLFGNAAGQDTCADPYHGSPAVKPGWIQRAVYERFFRILPLGVELRIMGAPFVPLAVRMALAGTSGGGAFQRHETVEVTAEWGGGSDQVLPLQLHYLHGRPADHDAFVGVVHRGEIYDRHCGWQWMQESPAFGVPFVAREVTLLVELPDDAAVLCDGYRQSLRRCLSKDQSQVDARDFAKVLRERMPGWMTELMASCAPQFRSGTELRSGISELMVAVGVKRRFWGVLPDSSSSSVASEAVAAPKASDVVCHEVPPDVVVLRDVADVAARGMEGLVARFYPESHTLFFNAGYVAFERLSGLLRQDASADEDLVRSAAEHIVLQTVARQLVFALAKRDSGWTDAQVGQAMSPCCLSVLADDASRMLGSARDWISEHHHTTQ
jgi:hypothetical protein